jgi:hypothetical protein
MREMQDVWREPISESMDEDLIIFLSKTKSLLTPSGVWCQGMMFQDADGKRLDDPSNACRFCLSGALYKTVTQVDYDRNVAEELHLRAIDCIWKILYREYGMTCFTLASWNDDEFTTHERLMKILDLTIDEVKENGYEQAQFY